MSAKTTIADQWRSFEAAVVAPSAGAVQRREMRQAFYGGAGIMLAMLEGLGHSDVSEDFGVHVLESWKAEMERFVAHSVVPPHAH